MPRKADAATYLRRRAVALACAGHRQNKIARLLGISVRSLQRWNAVWQKGGEPALAAIATRVSPGRPPKLTHWQAEAVLSWIVRDPIEWGFPNSWWTAPRLAELIHRRFGVSMNHRYLSDWLRHRGVSPQVPQIRPAERNQDLIDA